MGEMHHCVFITLSPLEETAQCQCGCSTQQKGKGSTGGNAELATKVAVVLLENATEGRLNTHKICVNLAESLIH